MKSIFNIKSRKIKSKAILNTYKYWRRLKIKKSFKEYLQQDFTYLFRWIDTKEGYDYWGRISSKIKESKKS